MFTGNVNSSVSASKILNSKSEELIETEKLSTELSKVSTGKTLYLMDEPTTGLHFHDIQVLLKVLNELVDRGNTLIVIEHNLDIVKNSDWIIDLGVEGGDKGGNVIFSGETQKIINSKKSFTAKYLKDMM